MIETKQKIREQVREMVQSLSAEEKILASERVTTQLKEALLSLKPNILISHIPLGDEVNINPIHDWFSTQGKVIFIEQNGSYEAIPEHGNIVILVPGRAFTKDGRRIGRWGGYYDKFLSQYPQVHTIGVCFASQIFENLPQDSWDITMSQVVFG